MNQQELDLIIEKHTKWLEGEEDGERADLCHTNLIGLNLHGYDLRHTNFRGANLTNANLNEANLRGADLTFARLCGAKLYGANLRNADLRHTNMYGADIRYAFLWSTIGNQREIVTMQTDVWNIVYTNDVIQIGCQRHYIGDWFKFRDEEISDMDSRALEWWKKWKPILELILER